jgi:DNA-binding GntR family transcriptional regulator
MNMPHDIRESVQRLRNRSLSHDVRDELERMILAGELEAGERLNEVDLANKLGVSRGPIREAARSLERCGLITTVANQGAFVRKLSTEGILELYDLRAMIAGYLCARVAECGSKAQKVELRGYVTRMEAAVKQENRERYFELNLDFHDHIAALSGAERATEMYVSFGKEVRLMRFRVLNGLTAIASSNEEHHQLVCAIERSDIDQARTLGARHHLNGKERLKATF